MSALDRSSPLPLWAQLADALRARAASGDRGDRFPTEAQLMSEYGVSRNTVREAMRRLEDEHLVERHRGRGTSLRSQPIERSLPGTYSLARIIEDQGLDERSVVRSVDVRVGDELAAKALEVAAGTELVYVERVRYAADEPLAIDRSWLPLTRCRGLLDADLGQGSLYDVLRDACAVHVSGGWERIGPSIPSSTDRALLGLPRGQAAFAIERLVRSERQPIEWRLSIVRGDRYRIVSTWP
jgi:GntR family transcriptional regulator